MRTNGFKSSLVSLLLMVILSGCLMAPLSVTTPCAEAELNIMGGLTYLISFFTSRPEEIIKVDGTYSLRLTVPSQYRYRFGGSEYIWARKLPNEKERKDSADNFLLPVGWQPLLTARFPTRGKEHERGYFNLDNVLYGDLKAPFKKELPNQDVTESHMMEVGIDLGGSSGGSIAITWRNLPLSGFTQEWINESTNTLGELSFEEWRVTQLGQTVPMEVFVTSCRPADPCNLQGAIPATTRLEIVQVNERGEQVVHEGNITWSVAEPLRVTPGSYLQIYLNPQELRDFEGLLFYQGQMVPLKQGRADLPTTLNDASGLRMVLWPRQQ